MVCDGQAVMMADNREPTMTPGHCGCSQSALVTSSSPPPSPDKNRDVTTTAATPLIYVTGRKDTVPPLAPVRPLLSYDVVPPLVSPH